MTRTPRLDPSPSRRRAGVLHAAARRAVLSRLTRLREGRLTVGEEGGSRSFGPGGDLSAGLTVLDPQFYRDVVTGGSVGAGESYMRGCWRSDDLTALLRLMLRNREAMDALETGLARLSAPLRVAGHWLKRNTRQGSRRNIVAHYDLGNDFFGLFLDDTRCYSCALFVRPEMTLAEASTAKLDLVCRKLSLQAQDRVVEIGGGWGGFALHAAGRYGCHVTTTTVSPSQFDLARERVRQAGLADRVTVLLEDYRDLRGTYDKLVSIEMVEAIGHPYFDTFFRVCRGLLRDGGSMLLQAITIDDRHFERARDQVDFIKRYIFPGSCMPSVGSLTAASVRAGLRLEHLEDIGLHYATTLAHWRANFLGQLALVRQQGYPDTFCRMWEFYLCYCEAGFAERALSDVQMRFVRLR